MLDYLDYILAETLAIFLGVSLFAIAVLAVDWVNKNLNGQGEEREVPVRAGKPKRARGKGFAGSAKASTTCGAGRSNEADIWFTSDW